ncbi:uncharacterized protein LOC135408639 [Pseudopipra pipra]|uniref:uncharacterized protein LOC135408639 n=1 Tax=Pseudopipra pipra TaxID=415032 RepID=UPI003138CBB7
MPTFWSRGKERQGGLSRVWRWLWLLRGGNRASRGFGKSSGGSGRQAEWEEFQRQEYEQWKQSLSWDEPSLGCRARDVPGCARMGKLEKPRACRNSGGGKGQQEKLDICSTIQPLEEDGRDEASLGCKARDVPRCARMEKALGKLEEPGACRNSGGGKGQQEKLDICSVIQPLEEDGWGEASVGCRARDGNVPREGGGLGNGMDQPQLPAQGGASEDEEGLSGGGSPQLLQSRVEGRDTPTVPGKDLEPRPAEGTPGEEPRSRVWEKLERLGEPMERWEGQPLGALAMGRLAMWRREFPAVWARYRMDCGRVAEEVDLDGDWVPPQREQPLPPDQREAVEELLPELLKEGIVVKGASNYNNLIVPTRKGTQWRLTLKCKALNKATPTEPEESLSRDRILASVPAGSRWFSVLDLSCASFAIPLAQSCWHRFAFTFQGQQFLFTRLPPGFRSTGSIMHRRVARMLSRLGGQGDGPWAFNCNDDILIAGRTAEEVEARTRRVLELIQDTGFKAKLEKAQLVRSQVTYLGATVGAAGRGIPDAALEELRSIPSPRDAKELRSLLGKFGYWRSHIPDYSELARPLHWLTGDGAQWEWQEEQQQRLRELREALVPVLRFPDKSRPFLIRMSLHSETAGATLLQDEGGGPGAGATHLPRPGGPEEPFPGGEGLRGGRLGRPGIPALHGAGAHPAPAAPLPREVPVPRPSPGAPRAAAPGAVGAAPGPRAGSEGDLRLHGIPRGSPAPPAASRRSWIRRVVPGQLPLGTLPRLRRHQPGGAVAAGGVPGGLQAGGGAGGPLGAPGAAPELFPPLPVFQLRLPDGVAGGAGGPGGGLEFQGRVEERPPLVLPQPREAPAQEGVDGQGRGLGGGGLDRQGGRQGQGRGPARAGLDKLGAFHVREAGDHRPVPPGARGGGGDAGAGAGGGLVVVGATGGEELGAGLPGVRGRPGGAAAAGGPLVLPLPRRRRRPSRESHGVPGPAGGAGRGVGLGGRLPAGDAAGLGGEPEPALGGVGEAGEGGHGACPGRAALARGHPERVPAAGILGQAGARPGLPRGHQPAQGGPEGRAGLGRDAPAHPGGSEGRQRPQGPAGAAARRPRPGPGGALGGDGAAAPREERAGLAGRDAPPARVPRPRQGRARHGARVGLGWGCTAGRREGLGEGLGGTGRGVKWDWGGGLGLGKGLGWNGGGFRWDWERV